MLVHYYKTKFEVSGGMHPKFLPNLYRVKNDRKSAISYFDWPDIGWTVPDRWTITGILISIINFNGGLQSLADCLVLILLLDWAS